MCVKEKKNQTVYMLFKFLLACLKLSFFLLLFFFFRWLWRFSGRIKGGAIVPVQSLGVVGCEICQFPRIHEIFLTSMALVQPKPG